MTGSITKRRSGSVSAISVRASSNTSLCSALAGSIVVLRSGRGLSVHALRGNSFSSPRISFNFNVLSDKITISPESAVSFWTISPLNGIDISVILIFSLFCKKIVSRKQSVPLYSLT